MKVIKQLLIWRSRYYNLRGLDEATEHELYLANKKICKLYEKYNGAIKHNFYLNQEIDSLYKQIKDQ